MVRALRFGIRCRAYRAYIERRKTESELDEVR